MPVSNLSSVLAGPLLDLETCILAAQSQIEYWLRSEWHTHAMVPFYGSVDLRNSGFKLAPVDMNLFPGGFNNLRSDCYPLAVQAAMAAVDRICPEACHILLIPENHTRNEFYLHNVIVLVQILEQAGFEVRVGTVDPDKAEPVVLNVGNTTLTVEPVQRRENRLMLADGFNPSMVLLNNDLSGGVPPLLCDIEQPIFPPLHAGWSIRRKTNHFRAYDKVCSAFAQLVSIDPWMINPLFSSCRGLDFQSRQGEDALSETIAALLDRIREKYREYDIKQDPFVIVKADAGTYGMGVMSVKRPEDVMGLNRKMRNKMSVIKEGVEVSEVIVQEGVYTFETIAGAVAEPVVYMMDKYVIGGFYRVHTERGIDENLNAPGMHFVPLSFDSACLPEHRAAPSCLPNHFYVYGVIARLSLLAASYELETTLPASHGPSITTD